MSRSRSMRTRAALPVGVLVCAGVAGSLLGCGSAERSIESRVEYELPRERSIDVETVVDLAFEEAWNALIRRLSESPYHVAALEKASRFVRIDLDRSSDLATTANKPARFVDCGRSVRTYGNAQTGESLQFAYAVAESSAHTESDPVEGGFRVSHVVRRVDLDASATIFLQPEGGERTRVTVKSRYRIEFGVSGDAALHPLDADEPIETAVAFGPRVESIQFTTFQPGRDRRSGGLTCRATGEFEHALIALANPAAAI